VLGAWIAKSLFGGKLVMSINNQPVIYARTRSFGQVKGAYIALLQRLFHSLVDHYFTINKTLASYLNDIGVDDDNITIFSMDTIERDLGEIERAKAGVIRAKYNIPPDAKVLLTVARLEVEKNYPRLLELFAGLGPGHVLIALGRGSMLDELKAQAEKLGVADRVIFTGYVERDDIWNYYKDADVFVLISKAEALGIVLWEAIYTDVPIVCSDVPGILETVGGDLDRARVWLEEDGQEGFTERTQFCITESRERDAMMHRARVFVEEQLQNKVTINTLPIWDKESA
jgi:1,2-diacylglycerol 3-alpha-glucosyltransferase